MNKPQQPAEVPEIVCEFHGTIASAHGDCPKCALSVPYTDGFDKCKTHNQMQCPICKLWTRWEDKISREESSDCKCEDFPEGLDEMVRDFTQLGSRPKSEVRRRIIEYALRRATEAEAAFLAANVKIAELEKNLNTPTA